MQGGDSLHHRDTEDAEGTERRVRQPPRHYAGANRDTLIACRSHRFVKCFISLAPRVVTRRLRNDLAGNYSHAIVTSRGTESWCQYSSHRPDGLIDSA